MLVHYFVMIWYRCSTWFCIWSFLCGVLEMFVLVLTFTLLVWFLWCGIICVSILELFGWVITVKWCEFQLLDQPYWFWWWHSAFKVPISGTILNWSVLGLIATCNGDRGERCISSSRTIPWGFCLQQALLRRWTDGQNSSLFGVCKLWLCVNN